MRTLQQREISHISGGWYATNILSEAEFGAMIGLLAAVVTPGLDVLTTLGYGACAGAVVGISHAVAWEIDYYLWTQHPLVYA